MRATARARFGDRARRLGGRRERRQRDVVRVGEGGLLAADRAHADALLDVEAARLDDAFLEAPALRAVVLEVQVRIVEAMTHQLAEDLADLVLAEAEGGEQKALGGGQRVV